MGRFLVAVLVSLIPSIGLAQVGSWKGRTYTPESFPRAEWCGCAMCQSLRAQWARSTKPQPQPMLASPEVVGTLSDPSVLPSETQYRYETRTTYETRTRTVNKCFGSYCRYVTETYQVPVTKTVRVPVVASVAANPSPKPEPAKVQEVSEPDPLRVTDLVETPQAVVDAMVATLAIPERGKFFDLGSGDGRFLKAAASAGAIAVGIELDADRAAESRSELSGLDALVFSGDVLEYDLAEAEYVSMYLYPELMSKVLPKLSPGVSIVSYFHPIPGLENERHSVRVSGEDHVFYFARVPGGQESYVATFGL